MTAFQQHLVRGFTKRSAATSQGGWIGRPPELSTVRGSSAARSASIIRHPFRRTNAKRKVGTVLLISLMMVSACGQVDPRSSALTTGTIRTTEGEQTETLTTYLLAEAKPGLPRPTFHIARMAGKLALSDGCIGLVSGSTFMTLAFAPGEAVWDQARRVLVVRGSDYLLGQDVEVGGSLAGGSAIAGVSPGVVERCRASPIWYVAP